MRANTYLKHFDAVEFNQLLSEVKAKLSSVRGKELVVFVGMTGSGKSTSINFFLGRPLKKLTNDLKTRYAVDESEAGVHAEIGHDQTSKTLMPDTFDINDSDLTLLDSAGLGDTRGVNVELCIALALKHISEVATIKGVAVVLNSETLMEARPNQARDLFKYISQLTDEFEANKFAFCITNTDSYAQFDDQKIKTTLIEKARSLAATIVSEIDPNDAAENQEAAKRYAHALSMMHVDNLFLMKQLDQLQNQTQLREAFFTYAKQMSGLSQGLRSAIKSETLKDLKLWGNRIANRGVEQLTALASMMEQHQKIVSQKNQSQLLLKQLEEALQKSSQVSDEMAQLNCHCEQLTQDLQTMREQQDEITSVEKMITIPLPLLGSGVSGYISKDIVIEKNPHFEQIILSPGMQIVSENQQAVTVRFRHEISGHEEANSMPVSLQVIYKNRHLPSFQEQLQTTARELDAVGVQRQELSRERKRATQDVDRLAQSIRADAVNLSVTLRDSDTHLQIVEALREHVDKLAVNVGKSEADKVRLEREILRDQENYAFLDEVSNWVDVSDEKQIMDFKSLYEQYNKVSQDDHKVVPISPASSTRYGLFARQIPRVDAANVATAVSVNGM